MDQDREQRIRERAHAIWQREGQPEGRHEDHWRQATEEVDRIQAEGIDPDRGLRETFDTPTVGGDAAGGAPSGAGGLATGLQPGGLTPGGGPGTSVGSVGTGGGSTGNAPTGDVDDGGR